MKIEMLSALPRAKTIGTMFYLTALLFLVITTGVFAKSNDGDHLYFKDLYYTPYKTIEQAEKSKKNNPQDADVLRYYANFYYITGSLMPLRDKTGMEYIETAFNVYKQLWKKDFSNPRLQILMANAYASQGNNVKLNMQTVLEYVFKARNIYNMVADRYPQNLEARLGRIRIHMNLTPETGRPVAIHREDIKVYQEGYSRLPASEQNNAYFKNGLMEVYLAQAMLHAEQRKWNEAVVYLKKIDTKLLHEHALKLYKDVETKVNKNR